MRLSLCNRHHVVRDGDTRAKVAEAYLDFSEVYLVRDFEKALASQASVDAGLKPGDRLTIPSVVQRAPKSADEEPPIGIYSEFLTRTMATVPGEKNGLLMNTFTPLKGLSGVVLLFLPGGKPL